MLRKEGDLLVDGYKKSQILNIPFSMGKLLDTKIQVSFLTNLPEWKETTQGFHHETNGDFKKVTELNDCDRRKLRMDQHIEVTPQY